MTLLAHWTRRLLAQPIAWLLPLLLLSGVVLGWRLWEGELRDYDEAIYATVAAELADTGDYLRMTYNGQPWHEKPPLVIALTALNYDVLGTSTLSTRLWPFLFAWGSVGLVFLIGSRLAGKPAGALAALILISTPQFLHNARTLMLDPAVLFFGLLGLWWLLRRDFWGKKLTPLKPTDILVVGVAFGLGFLSKGPAISGLIIGPLLLSLCGAKDLRSRALDWLRMAGVALLTIAPWYLSQLLLHGQTFIDQHIGYHLLGRAASAIEGHSSSNLYLAKVIWWGGYAWSWLLIPALFWLVRKAYRQQEALPLWPALAWLGALLPALLVSTKLSQYLVPSLPFLAITIGAALWGVLMHLRKHLPLAFGIAAVAFVGFLWWNLHLPQVLDCATPVAHHIRSWNQTTQLLIEDSAELNPASVFYARGALRLPWTAIQTRLDQDPNTVAVISSAHDSVLNLSQRGWYPFIATQDLRVLSNRPPLPSDLTNRNGRYSEQQLQRVCYPYMPQTVEHDPYWY